MRDAAAELGAARALGARSRRRKYAEVQACKRTKAQGRRFSCCNRASEDVTECTVAFTDDVPEAQAAPTLMQTFGDASGRGRRGLLQLERPSGRHRLRRIPHEAQRIAARLHEQRDHMLVDERIMTRIRIPSKRMRREPDSMHALASPADAARSGGQCSDANLAMQQQYTSAYLVYHFTATASPARNRAPQAPRSSPYG